MLCTYVLGLGWEMSTLGLCRVEASPKNITTKG